MKAFLLVVAAAAGLGLLVPGILAGEEPVPTGFPAAVLGTYRGTCRSEQPGGAVSEFAMELTLAPIEGREAFAFTIVYGEGERRQVRAYELLPGDAPGRFSIDERNGIVLPAAFAVDTLFSCFTVQGNLIQARYRFLGEAVEFEITSYRSAGTTGGKDGVPEVGAFGMTALQRAHLRKDG
jgi:hypothetical protein